MSLVSASSITLPLPLGTHSTASCRTATRMNRNIGIILLVATTTTFFVIGVIPTTIEYPEPSKGQIDPIATSTLHVKPTLNPALVPICTCESGQSTGKPQQFNVKTGGVLHGKQNPNDIGMCQINIQPQNGHLVASTKMGLDVFTEDGNIEYANYLYSKSGSTPWNWSKHCWGKSPELSTDSL